MLSSEYSSRRHFLSAFGGFPFLWRKGVIELASIRFRRLESRPGNRRYLLIHGDESTARRVLTEHMRKATGTAYLVTNETRTVKFDGAELDPNRLFSREGAEKSLQKLNPTRSTERIKKTLDRLDSQRGRLVEALTPPATGRIVALHNNARGYSMKDEIEVSDKTALNDAEHPYEFILCTAAADFESLAQGPYNVLLQATGPKDDDGSLSRLAARSGIRYVNIEAALGQFEKQRSMLEFLESSLP